jgi:hypothetical protein
MQVADDSERAVIRMQERRRGTPEIPFLDRPAQSIASNRVGTPRIPSARREALKQMLESQCPSVFAI